MIDADLVPAGPRPARRELRRSTLRPARPMALGGVVIVINQQRGAGCHLEMAATMRAGLRVAAALHAVLAGASRLGRGLIGLLMAGESRTADEPARHLAVVGLTYLALQRLLVALTAIEQAGGGPLLIALDIVYSAGIIRVGGLPARAYHDPDALYWTIAACNVAGVVGTVAAVRFVGRVGRAAPT